MNKQRKYVKSYTTNDTELEMQILADGIKGFFARGKKIAKALDQGKSIPKSLFKKRVINFYSPEEMSALLTKSRRQLIAVMRNHSASIAEIARYVHRNPIRVAKDIKLLEKYGIVKETQKH